jgi:hypothetical protein
MRSTLKLAAISTLIGCALTDQASAGWWVIVPEFDSAGATAAFALLAAVGAVLFSRSRHR